jgi:hypothetical protein
MESTTSSSTKTTPRDFFLWLGAIVALYGSITSFLALVFAYVNYTFPDALAYNGDPYGSALRFPMAAVIVLVPTTVVLMHILRGIILKEPAKANLWVRRWALGLTLFIASVTILIDLVTLINTFLGGEITVRFALKVVAVLAVALFIFFHTLADMKGYWITHGSQVRLLGVVVSLLALATVVAGFFIVGSPMSVRALRYDEQKVDQLRSIQYQLIDYWRVKQALPEHLDALKDPLTDTTVPTDPQTHAAYGYEKVSATSFKLCAIFNKPSPDTKGRGQYPTDIRYSGPGGGADENWQHGVGDVCFERTIDPAKYPPITNPKGI